MPRHKSAAKRVITNEKSRQRNAAAMSRIRAAIKSVRQAPDRARAAAALKQAASILDRAVAKGVLKRPTASRHKSRLALHVQRFPASA
jgi:small subunit ribosomal protein S20